MKMARQHSRSFRLASQRGFTLIEILISLGLMAILFLTMNTAMLDVTSTRNRVLQEAETTHVWEVAFSRMFDDVGQAFLADTSFQGKTDVVVTGFVGTSDSMNFSTMSGVHYIEDKHDSLQHHVGYFVRENTKGETELMRRSTDYLLPELDEGGKSFALMTDVKSIGFEYYDANKKTWKSEWDTNSVLYAGRLPQTVRVTLEIYADEKSAEENDDERAEIKMIWSLPIALYDQKINF